MAKIEIGTMAADDARAALIESERKQKSSSLWQARHALEQAGAVDGRMKDFDGYITRAKNAITDAERAHRNALRLSAAQEGE